MLYIPLFLLYSVKFIRPKITPITFRPFVALHGGFVADATTGAGRSDTYCVTTRSVDAAQHIPDSRPPRANTTARVRARCRRAARSERERESKPSEKEFGCQVKFPGERSIERAHACVRAPAPAMPAKPRPAHISWHASHINYHAATRSSFLRVMIWSCHPSSHTPSA